MAAAQTEAAVTKVDAFIRDQRWPEFASVEQVADPVLRYIFASNGVTAERVVKAVRPDINDVDGREKARAAIAYLIATGKVATETGENGIVWLYATNQGSGLYR